MKRRRPGIHRAMHIGRFAEPDFAVLPFLVDRISSQSFNVKVCRRQGDDQIVVTMRMPQRRITAGYGDIPDAHELIFKFGMMPGLAFDLDRILWRVWRL